MRSLHRIRAVPRRDRRRADRRRSGRQPRAVRRQPAHAAAARAGVEEVPRKVRRADHQDPARRGAADDRRGLFERVPAGRRARRSVAVVAAFVGAWAAKLGEWLPSLSVRPRRGPGRRERRRRPAVFEGLAVMVAVILATGVAFFSEYRSDQEFEKLNAAEGRGARQGARATAASTPSPLEDVVVGDLVAARNGRRDPGRRPAGEGRSSCSVDQSLMTGESEPVKKAVVRHDDTADGPEQPGCRYRGTQVVDGVGQHGRHRRRRRHDDRPDRPPPRRRAGDDEAAAHR